MLLGDAEPPLLGEHPRLALRVVNVPPRAGSVAKFSKINERMAQLSVTNKNAGGMDTTDFSTNLLVDLVVDDESSGPEIAAHVMPAALGVCGSCAHTAVVSCKAAQLDSSHSFFDVDARQCFGLQIILNVVAEARKAGKPCFLSFGLIEESYTAAVDLLCESDEVRTAFQAGRAKYRPSMLEGTIFSQLTEIDISKEHRPQSVVRSALDMLRRHHEKQQCDDFAVVTVGTGSSANRLYIIDVATPQRLRYAVTSYDHVCSPFINNNENDPRPELMLPLLIFGIGANARVSALLSMPRGCSLDEANHVRAVAKLRNLAGFPERRPEHPRTVSVVAHEQLALVHHLRSQINHYYHQAQESRVQLDMLGNDLQKCIADLAATRRLLSMQLPKIADSKERSTDAAAVVMRGRLALLTLLEREAEERETNLNKYHDWLLSLRVIEPLGLGESILHTERTRLLENTIEAQQLELDRLRRLVARDISVLRAEFHVLKQAAESKTPLECVFRSNLEKFAQETALIAQGDPSRAHAKCVLAIEQLTSRLRHDTNLFFGSSVSRGDQLESAACDALFRGSLDQIRRALGITIEPPSVFVEPSEAFWTECVRSNYVARSERFKLRCLASGLTMNCDKLREAIDAVAANAEGFVIAAIDMQRRLSEDRRPTFPGFVAGASSAESLVLAELRNSAPFTLRTDEAAFKVAQKKLIDGAATLKLRIAGCQGLVEGLRAASSATESTLLSRTTDDQSETAQAVNEYIFQRYDHMDVASTGGIGASGIDLDTTAGLNATGAGDGTDGPRVAVRLEEVLVAGASVKRAVSPANRKLRSHHIKQGTFSTLVRDTAQLKPGTTTPARAAPATPASNAATPPSGRSFRAVTPSGRTPPVAASPLVL